MDEVDSTEPALSVRAQVWATEKHLKKKKNHLVKNILIKDRQKSSTSTLQIGRKQATGKCGRVTDEGGRRRSCTDLHQRVSALAALESHPGGLKKYLCPTLDTWVGISGGSGLSVKLLQLHMILVCSQSRDLVLCAYGVKAWGPMSLDYQAKRATCT